MYHLPVLHSSFAPPPVAVTTTTSVASYPTRFLAESCVPSVLYEPRLSRSVFATDIPLVGISANMNAATQKCVHDNNLDEKILDEIIKKKVDLQIQKYQEEQVKEFNEERNKLRKQHFEATNCKACSEPCQKCMEDKLKISEQTIEYGEPTTIIHHHHFVHPKKKKQKEICLDEKIRRIREELNLPPERQEDKLVSQLDDYKIRFNNCVIEEEKKEELHHEPDNLKTKYRVNYVKERESRNKERSKSAESNKSRSASAKSRTSSPGSRPPWRPTGSNQYFYTHQDSLNDRKQSAKQETLDSSNTGTQTNSYLSEIIYPTLETQYTSVKPGKTTIKTTIDSNKYYVSDPVYLSTSYVTDHTLPAIKTTKNETTYSYSRPSSASYTYTTAEPYYYERTAYPLAKEYYYYEKHATKKNDNVPRLNPIEMTSKGALYANDNNTQIHYVSDKAKRNWASNKSPKIQIINSGETYIHE